MAIVFIRIIIAAAAIVGGLALIGWHAWHGETGKILGVLIGVFIVLALFGPSPEQSENFARFMDQRKEQRNT